jgi:hypothetical protein
MSERIVDLSAMSGRPISEVLVPRRKDIEQEFAQGFDGMTAEPVEFDALLKARDELVAEIAGRMPCGHRAFLLGFKKGEPDWSLLGRRGGREPACRKEEAAQSG